MSQNLLRNPARDKSKRNRSSAANEGDDFDGLAFFEYRFRSFPFGDDFFIDLGSTDRPGEPEEFDEPFDGGAFGEFFGLGVDSADHGRVYGSDRSQTCSC